MVIRYCEKCGTKLDEEDAFCWHCGVRIPQANKTAEKEAAEETEFPHILLTDSLTGLDVEFELLDRITYRQRDYIFLLPMKEDDEGIVTVLEVKNPGTAQESFEAVADEQTLNLVFRLFQISNEHRFNFSDE